MHHGFRPNYQLHGHAGDQQNRNAVFFTGVFNFKSNTIDKELHGLAFQSLS
jgi:hypothetical protein